MSLVDALNSTPAPKEPKSRIAAILLAVSPAERAALHAALRSPDWPHEALADVLTAQGHKVAEASVRRYRKGMVK